MKYITRGGSNPQGKAKVYFCAADADADAMLAPLAEEILACRNCAVWYHPVGEELDEAAHREALAEMRLFLIPVTEKLLTEPSRARDLEIPFAVEHHIPVLPLMQEDGLLSLYPSVFGETQYLSALEDDETGISYEDKYARFIDAVLVGGELAQRVRSAFDSYIFLSYRKKDRKYADALMRLIHKNKALLGVAIWYDEFLVPGENFNDAITEAMDKCAAVALAVTPNLVCEENYVAGVEYPLALEKGKRVLPVEFVPTDREALLRTFAGLASPAAAEAKAVARLFAPLAKRGFPHRRTAEHEYLMGIAYLSAIDVERDVSRAYALLTSAAKRGHEDAMEKLYAMYENGEGVERDAETAAEWLSFKADLHLKKTKKSRAAADFSAAAHTYFRLAEHYLGMGEKNKAQSAYSEAYACGKTAARLTGAWAERHFVALCQRSYAALSAENAQYEEARHYYRYALDFFEDEWKQTGNTEALAELTDCRLSLADCALARNNAEEARTLLKQAREALFSHKSEGNLRRIYIKALGKLGEFYLDEGENVQAQEYLLEHTALCRMRSEELKTAAARAALIRALALHARACNGLGDLTNGERLAYEALELARDAVFEDETPATLRLLEKTLSASYAFCRDSYEWQDAFNFACERLDTLHKLAALDYSYETALSVCSVYAELVRTYCALNRPEEAKPFIEDGIRLIQRHGIRDQKDPTAFGVCTAFYEAEGNLYRKLGQYGEARRVYEAELAERERFLALRESPFALSLVYNAYNALCWVTSGDIPARRKYAAGMLATARRRLEKENSYASRDGVWYGTERVAQTEMYAGEYSKAQGIFEEALALAEENARLYPITAAKCSLMITLTSLCDLFVRRKDVDTAEAYMKRSMALCLEVYEARQSNNDRRNLCISYERFYTLAMMREDKAAAREACLKALSLATQNYEEGSTYDSCRDLMRCAKKLYDLVEATDEEARAPALVGWFKGSVGLEEHKPEENTQLEIVLSGARLGDYQLAKGEAAEALENYELTLKHAVAMADTYGGETYFRNAAIMYRKIGVEHARGDNHFGAKNCFLSELDYRHRVLWSSEKESDQNELHTAEQKLNAEEEKLLTLYGIPKTEYRPPVKKTSSE